MIEELSNHNLYGRFLGEELGYEIVGVTPPTIQEITRKLNEVIEKLNEIEDLLPKNSN